MSSYFSHIPSAPSTPTGNLFGKFVVPKTLSPAPPVGPRLEPAGPVAGDSQRFYHPLQPGQKPSGYEPVWNGLPGRAGMFPAGSRPYWLATKGPSGDAALEQAKVFAASNTAPAMAILIQHPASADRSGIADPWCPTVQPGRRGGRRGEPCDELRACREGGRHPRQLARIEGTQGRESRCGST